MLNIIDHLFHQHRQGINEGLRRKADNKTSEETTTKAESLKRVDATSTQMSLRCYTWYLISTDESVSHNLQSEVISTDMCTHNTETQCTSDTLFGMREILTAKAHKVNTFPNCKICVEFNSIDDACHSNMNILCSNLTLAIHSGLYKPQISFIG